MNPSGPFPGTVLSAGDSFEVLEGVEPLGDPVGLDIHPVLPGVLVGGLENMRESLLRRLRTPVGYLPHRPEYGSAIPGMVGQPLDLDLIVSIRDEAARVLLADPRVVRVSDLKVDLMDDAIFVDASVETEAGFLSVSGLVSGVV